MGQYLLGRQIDRGQGPYGGAQPPHGRGGVDAVPRDLAHDQGDTGARQRDEVVPVAAQAGQLVRRAVAGGHLDGVLLRQPAREQTALQDERRVPLPGVAARVVHADGGARDEVLGQMEVIGVERVLAAATEEGGDTQGDPPGPDRDDHHALQPQFQEGGLPVTRSAHGPVQGERVEPLLTP